MTNANKGARIFLWMQIFFVVLGFVMFFGLKAIKEAQAEKRQQEQALPAPSAQSADMTDKAVESKEFFGDPDNNSCDYRAWIGKPVDEEIVKAAGRIYRILPPGAMATMDFNPERINVEIDGGGIVTAVTCG